jgi:hypothetical protein
MWITLGTGTSGAGVIAGSAGTTKMTQVACFTGSLPPSLVSTYISRFVVNMGLGAATNGGHVGCFFKLGSTTTVANVATTFGGFHIFRSNDGNGNPTAASAVLISNSTTTSGASSGAGAMQCGVFGAGVFTTVYPLTVNVGASGTWPTISQGATNAVPPLGGNNSLQSGTLTNGVVTVFPSMIFDGVGKFSAFSAVSAQNDIGVGVTASLAIVGTTALTFMSVGYAFGGTLYLGNASGDAAPLANAISLTYLVPWF